MEASIQNAFGKGMGEVARDIADFLSSPYVIGKEHPVELCSFVEDLNMHAQFSFALLSEALAQGWTLDEAQAFYRRTCAPFIDDAISAPILRAFRDPTGEEFRILHRKYGNDFSALDGSYWATVLSVAIDADEVERVLAYLRLFTVTLLEFAYMEDRNPNVTYSWCYYEAFGKALESFAAPEEPILPLQAESIGGTKSKPTEKGYLLSLCADIKNPNVGKMARDVSVDVTFKDKEGNVISTVRDRIQSIDPDSVYHYAVTKRIQGAPVSSIAVRASAKSHLSLSTPIMGHVTLSDVKIETDNEATHICATVKNGYDRAISALTLHYQYRSEGGKPLGGNGEWLLGAMEAGEERAFQASVGVPIRGIATLAYSVDFDALTLVSEEAL